jgi:hypothetical protein
MDASACDRMVRGLLQPSIKHPDEGLKQAAQTAQPVKESVPEQASVQHSVLTPAPAVAANEEKAASVQEGSPGQDLSESPSAATATPSASAAVGKDTDSAPALQTVYPAFKSLETTQEELDFMSRLAPVLGRSPRALKRFVNVYRLIKTGLTVHEARSFLQPNETLADYQAVLFLLAVDTGMPLLARDFFSVMEEGIITPPVNSIPHDINWLVKQVDSRSNRLKDNDSWRRVRDRLIINHYTSRYPVPGATPGFIPADTPLSVFAPWMQRVARFSFELGRS